MRVNTVGLWEIINQTSGRVGGWHKGRFRVMSIDLESAPERFEEARRKHEQAAVIGLCPFRVYSPLYIFTPHFGHPFFLIHARLSILCPLFFLYTGVVSNCKLAYT